MKLLKLIFLFIQFRYGLRVIVVDGTSNISLNLWDNICCELIRKKAYDLLEFGNNVSIFL